MSTPDTRIAPCHAAAVAVGVLVAACGVAVADDWTVTNLTPANWNIAGVTSVRGGVPVGQLQSGSFAFAGYWPSPIAASWTHLMPAGATSSSTGGGSALYQSGQTFIGGHYRASRWSGTAASWVDITPAGAGFSSAWGMDGDNPVGTASIGGDLHASLWLDDATNWIDLHPAGATTSSCYGGGGGQQAGSVYFGADGSAALWSGTADSYVNLHPAGIPGIQRSNADSADGLQQVGDITIDSTNYAALWSGSADSYVSLHPAGMTSSSLNDVFAGWQVGYVRTSPSHFTASLWNNTAESWFDLGALLGSEYTTSIANSVWTDGVTLYVGGSARNTATDGYDAILWTRTIPAPGVAGLLTLAGAFAARRRRTFANA